MKDLIFLEEKKEPTDCDFLVAKAEKTLNSLGDCFETMIDDKKTKMNVVGSIFSFAYSFTGLTFNVAGCAIKNTPKAIVAIAAVKREIITSLEEDYNQYQKELKEGALDEKIKQLQLKA